MRRLVSGHRAEPRRLAGAVPEDRPLVAEGEAARLVLGGYIRWVRGEMAESVTVQESSFQAKGLLTLRTRNSSAYKGLYALLRRPPCSARAIRSSASAAAAVKGFSTNTCLPGSSAWRASA